MFWDFQIMSIGVNCFYSFCQLIIELFQSENSCPRKYLRIIGLNFSLYCPSFLSETLIIWVLDNQNYNFSFSYIFYTSLFSISSYSLLWENSTILFSNLLEFYFPVILLFISKGSFLLLDVLLKEKKNYCCFLILFHGFSIFSYFSFHINGSLFLFFWHLLFFDLCFLQVAFLFIGFYISWEAFLRLFIILNCWLIFKSRALTLLMTCCPWFLL